MEPLPEDVLKFLDAAIQSIDQLEILRLLGEDPSQVWTVRELAPKVQTDAEAVAQHLIVLHSRGLVTGDVREGSPVWRHGAHPPEVAGQLDRLLGYYRERPVSMIKAVYNRPADVLRSFSDAFRFRSKEE